jgi:hypothetical protein
MMYHRNRRCDLECRRALEGGGWSSREGVQLPEKDWPIVAGALAARATHLITGDLPLFGSHFGKQSFGVLVLPPAAYLRSRRDVTSDS